MNTTLFDLNKTASAAAITAIGKDALATESIKLDAFTAAGHERADFTQWESFFTNHVRNYTAQQATPSFATKAAQIAANAAAAAAKAAAVAANKTAVSNANQTATSVSTPAAA